MLWLIRILAALGIAAGIYYGIPDIKQFWQKGQHFVASVESGFFLAYLAVFIWTWFQSFKRVMGIR